MLARAADDIPALSPVWTVIERSRHVRTLVDLPETNVLELKSSASSSNSNPQTKCSQPAKCVTGCMNLGARDRARTGDPQLGNVTGAPKLLWNSSYEWK